MKLKENKKEDVFHIIKNIFKNIKKVILIRKTKIVSLMVLGMVLVLAGILFGLLIMGFFGTLDAPSQRTIDFLHLMGIENLRELRSDMKAILNKNIFIPIDYIRGKLSRPKKIFINIDFEDYQRLEYKRQKALEIGALISSGEDYVPAEIRYNDEVLKAKIRLKGDEIDHLKENKLSYRIKMRGDGALFGMRVFSLQDPQTRMNLNEFVYHKALKREGVLSLRYDFVEVFINGKNRGIYAIEEHFGKELIEYNNRREGVIIKFNEDYWWEERANAFEFFSNISAWLDYVEKRRVYWFWNSNIETFDENIFDNPVLSSQFREARDLMESFRRKELKTSQVFDIDKLARYFALNTVLGAIHSSFWENTRFYYNPITSRLEPIGFDAYHGEKYIESNIFKEYVLERNSRQKIEDFHDLIFSDHIFLEKYLTELERISEESYLDSLYDELNPEIKKMEKIINKENVLYSFSKEPFYRNQRRVQEYLNPVKAMNVYFKGIDEDWNKIIFSVANINFLSLEITGLVYNNSIILDCISDENIISGKEILDPPEYSEFEFRLPEGFVWNNTYIKDLKLAYNILGTNSTNYNDISSTSY